MTATPILSSWIICPRRESPASLRLFGFPFAGGAASFFRPWAFEMPKTIEFCAIQYPGRESRIIEPAFTRLTLMVQTLAPIILPLLQTPFAFFGHSMGALISFELVHQLRHLRAPLPVALIISGCPAPQIPKHKSPIHLLPSDEFLRSVSEFNGAPSGAFLEKELVELMQPTLRADFELYETYVYADKPPLDCPILACGGIQDRHVSANDLEAWREQTSNLFTLRMFSGDHFFLQRARPLLLLTITQELARLQKVSHLSDSKM